MADGPRVSVAQPPERVDRLSRRHPLLRCHCNEDLGKEDGKELPAELVEEVLPLVGVVVVEAIEAEGCPRAEPYRAQ